jgi:5-methylthioadenosine/S-adenosylhomocysteine deaminase
VRWRRGLPPIVRTVEKGLTVSLSCDSESTSAGDMFSIMRNTIAVGRIEAANPPDNRPEPKDFNAANTLSTHRVLAMATMDGARTVGQEKDIGSIAIGKSADLLLLQADHPAYFPLHDPVDAIVTAADVSAIDAVFVAGRAVKFGGKLVDQAQLDRSRKLALASRDYLFATAGFPPKS